ncbi:MAG: CotH kinase family protein [Ruminococcus sp.]|nr:CotH kinase family protein [Ruminococcus sp.]
MKKLLALTLSTAIIAGSVCMTPVSAVGDLSDNAISFETFKALYVHGVLGSDDTEAWQAWQSEHDEEFSEVNSETKYFFLPTSSNDSKADVYNAFSSDVTLNGTKINSGSTKTIDFELGTTYSVTAEGKTYDLIFMKSNAEAGIYINNSDADGYGTELMTYLNSSKSNSSKASGAIVDSNGNIDNTEIKKIKGRGNTSWDKPKKGYNITYTDNVKIAGMSKSKKYSLLANYQDDSLSRNRFLYDLSDAVGMPYASDSRYVDLYSNGFYWGTYQICEKVEVGKNNLINDIDDKAYIDSETGKINEDFPFVCEVDASAGDDDYYVECSGNNKITIKSPELEYGDPGYDEVKNYVKTKFNAFYTAIRNKRSELSEIADIDSLTKIYLINELGKNWDSGVSSLFFTYKQDEDGNYKFYGSPVWDYDNSLGNANGIERELKSIGVSDYTKYTGWWCKYKGKGSVLKKSTNVMNNIAQHNEITKNAPQIWFENFVPAINDFLGNTNNGLMKSYKDYYSNLKNSAEMNYKSGWLLNTASWIADHSKLDTCTYDGKDDFSINGSKSYDDNFDGMYNYTVDWLSGRANWLSAQMFNNYTPTKRTEKYLIGDANSDGIISVLDATEMQKYVVSITKPNEIQKFASDANKDGIIDADDITLIQKYIVELEDASNHCGEQGEYTY